MRDILGYAVAALIGLWTATLQPWSSGWWAGVIIASAITLITSLHLLWHNLSQVARDRIRPMFWNGPDFHLMASGSQTASMGKIFASIRAILKWTIFSFAFLSVCFLSFFLWFFWPQHIRSSFAKVVLNCDLAPPKNWTVAQFHKGREAYIKNLNTMGATYGLAVAVSDISNGIRIVGMFSTDNGPHPLDLTRMLKQHDVVGGAMEVRRTEDKLALAIMPVVSRDSLSLFFRLRIFQITGQAKTNFENGAQAILSEIGAPKSVCHVL